MGVRNYLIEGVSGTGKSSVCRELRRRGLHAVDGDNDLAYQGDPATGEVVAGETHEHHIWDVGRVRTLVDDRTAATTFFCGGSRNFSSFVDWFDAVFVLQIDVETLRERLAERSAGEWGSTEAQREQILRLHATQEDVPVGGIPIASARPVSDVVDEIVALAEADARP